METEGLTGEQISKEIERVRTVAKKTHETVRIVFAPSKVDESNVSDIAQIYGRIGKADYDTVVIVESSPGEAEKKIPMSSHKIYTTSLGTVQVNDRLRNDFCDEDDDFFIDDEAFTDDMSLFDQLKVLQCLLDEFSVLSIQITDEGSFIVKELANALEEILTSKNALIVICCDLDPALKNEYLKIWKLIQNNETATLMNYLNSDDFVPEGKGVLIAGLMVANAWGLKLVIESKPENKYLTAYAEMQKHAIFSS